MGFAALAGDSIKSFFKRRIGIQSGSPWIPFDQLDFVVASLLVMHAWTKIAWAEAMVVLTLSFVADVVVNQASYRLGIKRDPW
jgi:CDP-2,3-bis-(O-geranylgeranyl)-sn-glycerol synthase